MIKGINVKKAFFTAALTGCILGTGCAKVSAQDPIYFNGVDDASVATYCDIYIDGQEYFIRKATLASVLPKFDESYNIGLRIDEKGNTIAIPTSEIEETDKIITCRKSIKEDGSGVGIYMSDVDNATIVTGYRVKMNGENYDLAKSDVVDFCNESGLSLVFNGSRLGIGKKVDFVANENGGRDYIKVRK